MAITRRQRQVYDYISDFVQRNGYSPSFEEIGEGMGLSSLATVHKHISNLEKKGLLTRDYNRSRSIDLLPPKGRLKQAMAVNTTMVLPLLGRIAAGQPIEAVLSRRGQHTPAAFECRHAPHHRARGFGGDSGKGDWSFAQILARPAGAGALTTKTPGRSRAL